MRRGGVATLGFMLFLVALGLRLGWIVLASVSRGAEPIFPDELLHWQMARNLATEGQLAADDGRFAARMPLYPLLLSLTAWLGPLGMTLVRLWQAVLGAATAWLVYQIGASAIRQRVGVVAGALVALDPYAIFFSHLLLTEVTFTCIGVLLVGAAWRALSSNREQSFEGMVGVALFGALAIMTRPSSAAWVGLLWLLLLVLDRNRGRGLRRIGVYSATVAVFLLPWGLRNWAVIGDFAWLSANGGATLYDAQGPQARGDSDQTFLQEFEQDPAFVDLREAQRDRYLRDKAIEHMWADPGRVMQLAWTKFLRTWSLRPNIPAYSGGIYAAASIAFMLPVLLAAAWGVVRGLSSSGSPAARRNVRRLVWLCLLPIVAFTLVHCIYVGSLRYRVPVMPFVELLAGMALLSGAAGRRPPPSLAKRR